jgi:hypothetical protein
MRLLIILTTLTTILGCEKQGEQVEKFVFDTKQISTKDIHKYEFYGDGKVKTVYSTNYMYMAAVPFDSMTYVKHYEYNSKGNISNIFYSTDSTRQTKFYNDLDSLIADYTINKYGDTTRLSIANYVNGKRTKVINRILHEKFSENVENFKKGDRIYDTISFITELIYKGDLQTKSLSLDRNGTVTEEVHLLYDSDRRTKAVTYSFVGDTKYITKTTIFSDNKTADPDQLTVGTNGDTIEFRKTIFQDQNKIVIDHMGLLNMQELLYYDKNSKLIGTVLLDQNDKVKTVTSFKYDSKGNMVEEASYRERIKITR